jgi:Domain of unknown function (DUF3291)
MSEKSSQFHLAQINIARMKAPLDDPQMQAFVEGLEPINALADAAPGFVWRLQDDAGNATSYRPFPDDWLLVNMSVWQSVESLRQFTYKTVHVNYVKQRKVWFEKLEQPVYALWWLPVGQIPTIAEAKTRLDHLVAHGESPTAFTFGKIFEPITVH